MVSLLLLKEGRGVPSPSREWVNWFDFNTVKFILPSVAQKQNPLHYIGWSIVLEFFRERTRQGFKNLPFWDWCTFKSRPKLLPEVCKSNLGGKKGVKATFGPKRWVSLIKRSCSKMKKNNCLFFFFEKKKQQPKMTALKKKTKHVSQMKKNMTTWKNM